MKIFEGRQMLLSGGVYIQCLIFNSESVFYQ